MGSSESWIIKLLALLLAFVLFGTHQQGRSAEQEKSAENQWAASEKPEATKQKVRLQAASTEIAELIIIHGDTVHTIYRNKKDPVCRE